MNELLTHIDQAFASVELGDGVGLHETQVIDDYGTDEERRVARDRDEKLDWRKLIDDPDLTRYFSIGYAGMSFLDGAGVRFHLPACLYRAVRDFDNDQVGEMIASLLFLLTVPSDYNISRLDILSSAQRVCVRKVLVYLCEVLGSDDEGLVRAIDGYWSPR